MCLFANSVPMFRKPTFRTAAVAAVVSAAVLPFAVRLFSAFVRLLFICFVEKYPANACFQTKIHLIICGQDIRIATSGARVIFLKCFFGSGIKHKTALFCEL